MTQALRPRPGGRRMPGFFSAEDGLSVTGVRPDASYFRGVGGGSQPFADALIFLNPVEVLGQCPIADRLHRLRLRPGDVACVAGQQRELPGGEPDVQKRRPGRACAEIGDQPAVLVEPGQPFLCFREKPVHPGRIPSAFAWAVAAGTQRLAATLDGSRDPGSWHQPALAAAEGSLALAAPPDRPSPCVTNIRTKTSE